MFYSPSMGGFYSRELHGDNIPSDAVEITPDKHAELLSGQSAGLVITGGRDGFPVLNEPPPPTPGEILAIVKSERDRLLALAAIRIAPLQDAADLDEASPEELARLRLWKQYRIALNRVELQSGFPSEIEWPLSPDTSIAP